MRTRPTPWLALGLALLVASTAARVVEQSGPSIEPSRTKRAHLSAEQRERLTALLDVLQAAASTSVLAVCKFQLRTRFSS